jgi:hypothetical protein
MRKNWFLFRILKFSVEYFSNWKQTSWEAAQQVQKLIKPFTILVRFPTNPPQSSFKSQRTPSNHPPSNLIQISQQPFPITPSSHVIKLTHHKLYQTQTVKDKKWKTTNESSLSKRFSHESSLLVSVIYAWKQENYIVAIWRRTNFDLREIERDDVFCLLANVLPVFLGNDDLLYVTFRLINCKVACAAALKADLVNTKQSKTISRATNYSILFSEWKRRWKSFENYI